MKTDKEKAYEDLRKSKLSTEINWDKFKYESDKINIKDKFWIEDQFPRMFDFIYNARVARKPIKILGYDFKKLSDKKNYSHELKFNSGVLQDYRMLVKLDSKLIIKMHLIKKVNFDKFA